MKLLLKVALVGLAVLAGGGAGAAFYLGVALQNRGKPMVATQVEIEEGLGGREIAGLLKEKGVIASPLTFLAFALWTGQVRNLQSGIYLFGKESPVPQIVAKIAKGEVHEHKLTFPEGFTARQIGERLAKRKVVSLEDFLTAAQGLEGYLFPDTYRFAPGITTKEVVERMRGNFAKKTAQLSPSREQLIVASIVEREAKRAEDRPLIAGVYWNRLKAGMFLEADPTVQYAKGSWEPISPADYKTIDSPYNTYLYQGLPPGPIANPGLAAIEAAVKPASHHYFYFFHRPDGSVVFSETKEEHEARRKEGQ